MYFTSSPLPSLANYDHNFIPYSKYVDHFLDYFGSELANADGKTVVRLRNTDMTTTKLGKLCKLCGKGSRNYAEHRKDIELI